MASGMSDLIVRLSLDTTQFEGSLSKFEGQMTKLQASSIILNFSSYGSLPMPRILIQSSSTESILLNIL